MPFLYPAFHLIFWACLGGVVYVYLGYPLLVWSLSKWFGRRHQASRVEDEQLPSLTLLIAAHNEEAVIEDRIRNALAMDYPSEKLDILIACDGCHDATPAIVRRYGHKGVRVLDYQQRRGKSATLNAAFEEVSSEVVMLSDANTNTDPASARNLARWFSDPNVGVVCGRLILTDPATGRNVDGLYWKYETFLKRCEGRLGALLGVNGGIYAIRRSLFEPIPPDTIIDDFFVPLDARLRSGCSILYDRDAVAEEETAANIGGEFRRRARIGAGGFQSISRLAGLLNPLHGWVAFTFLSHKVLRWLCPFALLLMLASNLMLVGEPLYRAALLAQFGFYALALVGAWLPGRSLLMKLLRLPAMFTGMNFALLVGFWRWLRNGQKAAWQRTSRSGEVSQSRVPRLFQPDATLGLRSEAVSTKVRS